MFDSEAYQRTAIIHPLCGMRIKEGADYFPKSLSEKDLPAIYESLTNTPHDLGMLMETAAFDEVDAYYNPGTEEVSYSFILEAIVVEKFSKMERRMAAVVRVFNKHLKSAKDSGGNPITALAPIVGKPRKAGTFAYVTAQLPFSDGQVVSVIFHSPEGDKQRIAPDDQLIAYRWLLNKRDITHIVAPEKGSEISLESIAARVTQLVAKNSEKFERTQKTAAQQRKELEETQNALKQAEERELELQDQYPPLKNDLDGTEALLADILARLEKLKAENAELEAKIAALKKAKTAAAKSDNSGMPESEEDSEFATMSDQEKIDYIAKRILGSIEEGKRRGFSLDFVEVRKDKKFGWVLSRPNMLADPNLIRYLNTKPDTINIIYGRNVTIDNFIQGLEKAGFKLTSGDINQPDKSTFKFLPAQSAPINPESPDNDAQQIGNITTNVPQDEQAQNALKAQLAQLDIKDIPKEKLAQNALDKYESKSKQDQFLDAKILLQNLMGKEFSTPLGEKVYFEPGNTESLDDYVKHLSAGMGKSVDDIRASRVLGIELAKKTIDDPYVVVEQQNGRRLYLSMYEIDGGKNGTNAVVIGVEEGNEGRVVTVLDAFDNKGDKKAAIRELKKFINRSSKILYLQEGLSGHSRPSSFPGSQLNTQLPGSGISNVPNNQENVNTQTDFANNLKNLSEGQLIQCAGDLVLRVGPQDGTADVDLSSKYRNNPTTAEYAKGYAFNHASKIGKPLLVYAGNSNMNFVWRVADPKQTSAIEINNGFSPEEVPVGWFVTPFGKCFKAIKPAQEQSQTDVEKETPNKPESSGDLDAAKVAAQFTDAELAEKGERIRNHTVAEVPANVITGKNSKEIIKTAQDWVKKNITSPIHTEIGEVEVDESGIAESLGHKIYQNKLDAIQAIEPVLQHGEYLGTLPDKDGKPINNYYFAGKVKIGENEKIVFIRARLAQGVKNRFYVHEVYTQEEIENLADPRIAATDKAGHQTQARFYKMIIGNALNVKPESGTDESNPTQSPLPVEGKQADIQLPDGTAESTTYVLMEADNVQASHLPDQGFQKNPAYGLENERRYHAEPASQDKVLNNAANLKPQLLLEYPTVGQGAPVIDKQNNVLGGNSRAMSIKLAYEKYPAKAGEYRAALRDNASKLGIDPDIVDKMKKPMLVRRISGDYSKEERQGLVSKLNDKFTYGKDARAESKTRGDRFSKRSLDMLGEGMKVFDTLRKFLDDPSSKYVVEQLIKDGVIMPSERNQFIKDGLLNSDGKDAVEEALHGRIARKYETLAKLPPHVIAKLDAITPSILISANLGGDWDITEALRDAIDLLAGFKSGDPKDISKYLNQYNILTGGTLNDKYSELSKRIFRLAVSEKKGDFAKYFQKYSELAQKRLIADVDSAMSPWEAQRQAFGADLSNGRADSEARDMEIRDRTFYNSGNNTGENDGRLAGENQGEGGPGSGEQTGPESAGSVAGSAAGRTGRIGGIGGKSTKIEFPSGRSEPASYALVETEDVQASHIPEAGFIRNGRYELENERRYHEEAGSQEKVLNNAMRLNPALLLEDSPDAEQGAPIIDQQGNVLGGNGRAMSIRLAYSRGGKKAQEYRDALRAKAAELGIDPALVDGMRQPMLVRRIDSDYSLEDRQKLVTELNDSFTDSKDARADSKSRGERFSRRSISMLGDALQNFDTLREFFDDPSSIPVVEQLIEDGVIQASQRDEYVREDGLLKPKGKNVIEAALHGRIARDYEILADFPQQMLAKIDAIAPHVLIAESVGGDWKITENISDAIELLAKFNASGSKDVNLFLTQPDIRTGKSIEETYNPISLQFFSLALSDNKTEFTKRFRKYAKTAVNNSSESNAFLGMRKSAGQAQTESFGISNSKRDQEAERIAEELKAAEEAKAREAERKRKAAEEYEAVKAKGEQYADMEHGSAAAMKEPAECKFNIYSADYRLFIQLGEASSNEERYEILTKARSVAREKKTDTSDQFHAALEAGKTIGHFSLHKERSYVATFTIDLAGGETSGNETISQPDTAEPSYLATLRDIASGKYGEDRTIIRKTLRELLTKAQSNGELEKYRTEFEAASNYLSNLLRQQNSEGR